MGTNYYMETEPCPHCGRSDEPVHIGKSSAGWCFALHVHPERNINSLADWQAEWAKPGVRIVDEYETALSPVEMERVITVREFGDWPKDEPPTMYGSWKEFHRENRTEPGPNGLLRRAHDHWGRVGAGEGTWDLLEGDFS